MYVCIYVPVRVVCLIVIIIIVIIMIIIIIIIIISSSSSSRVGMLLAVNVVCVIRTIFYKRCLLVGSMYVVQ
jgi:hypothetical protein